MVGSPAWPPRLRTVFLRNPHAAVLAVSERIVGDFIPYSYLWGPLNTLRSAAFRIPAAKTRSRRTARSSPAFVADPSVIRARGRVQRGDESEASHSRSSGENEVAPRLTYV